MENSTIQQIKIHNEKQSKVYKARTCLFSAVSESLFIKIMNLETAFKIWEYLKQEFQGNARTKSMRILNLKREFELQKMKDSETVKEYADKLFEAVNKLRLIGEQMPDNMAPALPDDMIFQEILIRLPFKSLVRFRCVCKLWNSALSDRDLMQPHLNRSISQNPDDEYLIRTWPGGVAILSRSNLCEIPVGNIPYPVPCPDYLHMVGSINGLVCLARLSEPRVRFILWNPAIHLSKEILLPQLCCNHFCYRYGFSWDSVADDYKLIAIPSGRRASTCTHSRGLAYSSKTGCWSNIADPPLVEGLNFPSVIVKGTPYWKCLMLTAILKFEARSSEFTRFAVSKDAGKRYNLVNLNDCLARIEFAGRADGMDVYQYSEENNGWWKMFRVNFTENLILSCPVCFKYGGEIVFNGSFYLTDDSKSTRIKRLAYQINRNIGIHGHSYTPSLVVLEGMEPLHRLQGGEIDPEVIRKLEQKVHRLTTILVGKPHP